MDVLLKLFGFEGVLLAIGGVNHLENRTVALEESLVSKLDVASLAKLMIPRAFKLEVVGGFVEQLGDGCMVDALIIVLGGLGICLLKPGTPFGAAA